MIIARISDPVLRHALRAAALPEEDVVDADELVAEALEWGAPRLIVQMTGAEVPRLRSELPVVELSPALLRRWEAERRVEDLFRPRADFVTERLRRLIDHAEPRRTWVDTAFAELTRAAGTQLPGTLRGFGRRVMEFPSHYAKLTDVAEACHLSHGALKARFRRKGLSSPYTYLRWFRALTIARTLADRDVSVAEAARRLGFTSDGNLCRAMLTLTGMTPTEARTVQGWNRIVVNFVWLHLGPDALAAWEDMGGLFKVRAA